MKQKQKKNAVQKLWGFCEGTEIECLAGDEISKNFEKALRFADEKAGVVFFYHNSRKIIIVNSGGWEAKKPKAGKGYPTTTIDGTEYQPKGETQ